MRWLRHDLNNSAGKQLSKQHSSLVLQVARLGSHPAKDVKLLADDHQLLLDGIKAALAGLTDFNIAAEAYNGFQVLEKLETGLPIDIILMDIQMPIMDGLTATKIIRNQLKSTIPILALTANTSANDEIEYRKSGMNDQLSKPFKRNELLQKISRLISNK